MKNYSFVDGTKFTSELGKQQMRNKCCVSGWRKKFMLLREIVEPLKIMQTNKY